MSTACRQGDCEYLFVTSSCAQAQDAVATPYANGILELACEREILDDVHKDLMGLQVCGSTVIVRCSSCSASHVLSSV